MATKKILIQIQVGAKDANIAISKVEKSLQGLSDAQMKVVDTTKKARTQSGLNNAILLETGRLASDASFGFTAIANNLSQVITLFQSFARTNGGFIKSIGLLLKQLIGPAGVLIAIQLLISFGDKIVKFFKGSADAAEEEKERIKELNEEIEKNVNLRQQQLDQLRQSFGILTSKITMDALGNISKVSKATQEDLLELSDRFKEAGVKNADILRDEELSLERRTEIAKLMLEIFEDETNLKSLRQKFDEQVRDADIDGAKKTADFIRQTQKDRFDAEQRLAELSKKTVIERDKNLKTLSEMMGFEATMLFEFIEKNEKNLDLVLERIFANRGKKSLEAIMQEISLAIMAEKELAKTGKKSTEEFAKFGEKFIEIEAAMTKGKKIESETRQRIDRVNARSLTEFGIALRNLSFLSDEFRIASILAEKAAKISEIIVETKAANAKINAITSVQSALGIPGAKIRGRILRTQNNVASAINIAAIIAQAATGISAIRSKSNISGGVGGGTGPTGDVEAPDFNVVGASETSQLATSLAGVTGRPIQAFVVSKQVTTQQELDRNITNNASIN